MKRSKKVLAASAAFALSALAVVGLTACARTAPVGTQNAASAASAPVTSAMVEGGAVAGAVEDGVGVFKGIPFAAPPVGPLRWKAPQPVLPWKGVKKADEFGPAPMQNALVAKLFSQAKRVSEDCLYLNVWTPAKSARERLPVMVWIYGGAYMMGATSQPLYNGAKLAKKGVVVVSVAYRLGPFGFLAHPQLSAESGKGSGDYGLLDQIAGLRWVKNNIARFGGDPSRVTAFGESAGGISVSVLMCAPPARGLFQQAISESGVMMAPVVQGSEVSASPSALSLPEAERRGVAFLAKLGVKDIAAARALSADRILDAGSDIHDAVVDGNVIPGDQYRLFEAGRFADVPLLAGWNGDDGAMFAPKVPTPERFTGMVRAAYGASADAVLSLYPHGTPAEAQKSMNALLRDTAFGWPTWARAGLLTRHGKSKAFLYYFNYTPDNAPAGPGHGAEIPYVFGKLGNGLFGFGAPKPAARKVSDEMMSYWVNFATTGDPNGPGLPAWPAFHEPDAKVLKFATEISAQPVPNLTQLQALDAYFAKRRAAEPRR